MTRRRGKSPPAASLEPLWERHGGEFRDPQEVIGQWQLGPEVDSATLDYQVEGDWWDVLARTGVTLLATREYEHLVVALTVHRGRPRVSFLRLPHPNGMAVSPRPCRVFVASTRNPNLVYDFAPCSHLVVRAGVPPPPDADKYLIPVRCRYLPGSLYLHDLALIGERLYANAVALNAVVELPAEGGAELAWWPRCIEGAGGRLLSERNYLQLNSIAAGPTLVESFFSASAASPSRRRPGHLNFPVDRRGVIFSGATREVVVRGLTRPHSARLLGPELWVDNSGYGEVGVARDGRFEPVARLPGWTRGLCAAGGVVFVATSRVIPRYRHYAPGLDCDSSRTGVHALEQGSGRVLGSLFWPMGNQVFALEALDAGLTIGFPGTARQRGSAVRDLFFLGSAVAIPRVTEPSPKA